jgi:hypothetical protein
MQANTQNTSRPTVPFQSVSQRRTAVRYLLQAPVAFCWMDAHGVTRHGDGRTHDVSTKGIRVFSSVALPLGTSVAMNIDIPLSRADLRLLRVEIEGPVVRVENSPRPSFCIQYDRIICPD